MTPPRDCSCCPPRLTPESRQVVVGELTLGPEFAAGRSDRPDQLWLRERPSLSSAGVNPYGSVMADRQPAQRMRARMPPRPRTGTLPIIRTCVEPAQPA